MKIKVKNIKMFEPVVIVAIILFMATWAITKNIASLDVAIAFLICFVLKKADDKFNKGEANGNQ